MKEEVTMYTMMFIAWVTLVVIVALMSWRRI